MGDPRNEMKIALWSPRKGPHGEYVMCKFTLNGVDYSSFLGKNEYKTGETHPSWKGTIKVDTYNKQQAPVQQRPVTQAPVDGNAPVVDPDLPF